MNDDEGRRLLENEDQRLLEDVEHPLENLDMDLLLENRLGEFGRYGVHFQRGSRVSLGKLRLSEVSLLRKGSD